MTAEPPYSVNNGPYTFLGGEEVITGVGLRITFLLIVRNSLVTRGYTRKLLSKLK